MVVYGLDWTDRRAYTHEGAYVHPPSHVLAIVFYQSLPPRPSRLTVRYGLTISLTPTRSPPYQLLAIVFYLALLLQSTVRTDHITPTYSQSTVRGLTDLEPLPRALERVVVVVVHAGDLARVLDGQEVGLHVGLVRVCVRFV